MPIQKPDSGFKPHRQKRCRAALLMLLTFCGLGYAAVPVRTGLDVLIEQRFKPLRGKRVGLITNHTAVDRHGRSIVEAFAACPAVKVVALFAPEHGLTGGREAGESLPSQIDPATGAPVYSLYGSTNKPTAEMLQGIEVLVFDIQDVGARFYTYISTLFLAMEAAAEAHIAFMVLDRPNPSGGLILEGPVLKKEHQSFVGIRPIALRHGMTIAELARLFNGEKWLADGRQVALSVIKMKGWQRKFFFQDTGLPWINPSPNIRSPQTTWLYPGMCLLEATNLSEGRGTYRPFEWIGAPWIDADTVCAHFSRDTSVIRITPVQFTPVQIPGTASRPKYQDRVCHGLELTVLKPDQFLAVPFSLQLLALLRQLYPDSLQFNLAGMNRLSGDELIGQGLRDGLGGEALWQAVQPPMKAFRKTRQKYLLY